MFFLSKNRYWPRDNQIDFLFSGHFHIGLVIIIIKQAGYIKKTLFLSIIYQESKKGYSHLSLSIGGEVYERRERISGLRNKSSKTKRTSPGTQDIVFGEV